MTALGLSIASALPAAALTAVVPVPGATSSVVTVKTGGDRVDYGQPRPLAGVRLGLYTDPDAVAPVNDTWALCTSDADGDCSFTVPDTGAGGTNENVRFWVRQLPDGVPAGWYTNPSLRTGPGSGSSSVASPYEFQTPQLQGGRTYRSTADFMISSARVATASGGWWQQSRNNPTLRPGCGLDVALVLDLSSSVGSQLPNLKAAANTFADSLVGTPSRMAVYSFDANSPSSGADANHPELRSVSTQAGADAFKDLYADWVIGRGTNWDQGLFPVARSGVPYEVVVVLTDGNPTYYGKPPEGDGSNTRFREVENGIFSANSVKATGARVLAMGVGSGVVGQTYLNLRAISGTTAYNGTNTETADYYQTTDYAAAGQALRDLALGACQGTLSVTKQIAPAGTTGEDVTGATPAGPGWVFTADSPGVPGLPSTQTTTSDGTGTVTFPIEQPPGSNAAVTVTETQQPGFSLVTQNASNAICVDLGDGNRLEVTNTGGAAAPGFTVNVPSGSAVSCTVYNREAPVVPSATVRADKLWVVDGQTYPNASRPPGMDATLTLTGPGTAGATAQPWGVARPGYSAGDRPTIDETVTVTDPLCRLTGSRVTTADGVTVDAALPYTPTLAAGDNTYTVTNTVACESRLTLVKQVENTHGGTAVPGDWTLSATGPDTITGHTGEPAVTGVIVGPGSYTLAESGPADYDASAWTCRDTTGRVTTGSTVTLVPRQEVTCTIVNRDREKHPGPTIGGHTGGGHANGGHTGGGHTGGGHASGGHTGGGHVSGGHTGGSMTGGSVSGGSVSGGAVTGGAVAGATNGGAASGGAVSGGSSSGSVNGGATTAGSSGGSSNAGATTAGSSGGSGSGGAADGGSAAGAVTGGATTGGSAGVTTGGSADGGSSGGDSPTRGGTSAGAGGHTTGNASATGGGRPAAEDDGHHRPGGLPITGAVAVPAASALALWLIVVGVVLARRRRSRREA